jgi:hypothetical protein
MVADHGKDCKTCGPSFAPLTVRQPSWLGCQVGQRMLAEMMPARVGHAHHFGLQGLGDSVGFRPAVRVLAFMLGHSDHFAYSHMALYTVANVYYVW